MILSPRSNPPSPLVLVASPLSSFHIEEAIPEPQEKDLKDLSRSITSNPITQGVNANFFIRGYVYASTLSTSTITFTPSASVSGVTANCARFGNLVDLNISLTIQPTVTKGVAVNLGSIQNIYAPVSPVYSTAYVVPLALDYGFVEIDSSGNVSYVEQVATSSSALSIALHMMFLAQGPISL